MSRRREFITLLGGAAMAWPFAVIAQSANKVWRIGFLWPAAGSTERSRGFIEGLRERGYIEGQNLTIEYRFTAEDEPLAALAADLVRANVDVIVVATTPATLAVTQATRTIPIVFMAVGDPVEKGIVASLAHPGGNATGLAMITDLVKPLELLKEAVPGITRVVLVHDPATRPGAFLGASLMSLQNRARALSITIETAVLRQPDDVERVFAALATDTNALLLDTTRANFFARERICELAIQRRLPTASVAREMADAGCLMSYGENLTDIYRRGAIYVDKILKGARPADLPVEQPTKFALVINLRTAKALGIEVPISMQLLADEVIE
jgi:putative ABC transport system substrate-binding protein